MPIKFMFGGFMFGKGATIFLCTLGSVSESAGILSQT